jgi:hypothetical protein
MPTINGSNCESDKASSTRSTVLAKLDFPKDIFPLDSYSMGH